MSGRSVTVVYLRNSGSPMLAHQTFGEGVLSQWREGIDFVYGHIADGTDEAAALVAAKKLAVSAEGTVPEFVPSKPDDDAIEPNMGIIRGGLPK